MNKIEMRYYKESAYSEIKLQYRYALEAYSNGSITNYTFSEWITVPLVIE